MNGDDTNQGWLQHSNKLTTNSKTKLLKEALNWSIQQLIQGQKVPQKEDNSCQEPSQEIRMLIQESGSNLQHDLKHAIT